MIIHFNKRGKASNCSLQETGGMQMYPVSCRVNQLFRMACKTGTESTFYYNKDCLSYSNFTSHHLSLEPQLNKILNIGYIHPNRCYGFQHT